MADVATFAGRRRRSRRLRGAGAAGLRRPSVSAPIGTLRGGSALLGHTLQTTGLVHEAVPGELVHQDRRATVKTRAQFLGVASQVMRRILVDAARERQAAKRGGGGACLIVLDDSIAGGTAMSIDVLALDQALDRLAARDPRQARIVELRYFAGLSVEETADSLGLSPANPVKREWSSARAWLFTQLDG